jgi:Cdc6-like AAA superfamily ATPase
MDDELSGKIKALIAIAQKRGYLTFDELNEAMPVEDYTSEQIEDIVTVFAEKGVELVDFPNAMSSEQIVADRETVCAQSIGRLETAVAALRRGRVGFACQLLEASLAELRPFTGD